MGIQFSSFTIRGVDVSQYNGTVDWTKTNCHFAAIRVGYGRVLDTEFKNNWMNAKGKVDRLPYWYLDYYSNHDSSSSANGISDEDWGRIQAETCWNAIKDDPSGIVFLDIENGNPTYAPPITSVTTRVQTIGRVFLERMDVLNGKVNGIYKSIGMLNWFDSWFRNRPLWVAWYNEAQTPQSVLSAVSNNGWSGNCLIWQYAEDGDIDDDGKGDGIVMGAEYTTLDLNGWLGSAQQYAALFGKEEAVELYRVKILIYNLLVRSGPGMLYSRLRRADFPGEYGIFEEQNGYGRISTTKSEWISLNPEYVQKLQSGELSDAEKLARLWAAHPELH